jgi:Protein of unknown function (DUF4012)
MDGQHDTPPTLRVPATFSTTPDTLPTVPIPATPPANQDTPPTLRVPASLPTSIRHDDLFTPATSSSSAPDASREDSQGELPIGVDGVGKGSDGKGKRIPLRRRNFSIRLVMVFALLSVVMGFCFTQGTLTAVDAASAAADARAQVNALEALLKNGRVTDPDHLREAQSRLATLHGDLVRLQIAMPGPVGRTAVGASLSHTLTMGLELVQAGQYAVDAAIVLIPHLKGALSDLGSSASTPTVGAAPGAKPAPPATAPPTAPPGGVTLADVTRAQQDILVAGILAQQALNERKFVDDSQLSKVGLGSVVAILQKMDGIAPKLPTYLGYANSVLSALPSLLGITKPAHFLLFDVDSDELRSTGGFMGNFALLTVQYGRLIGGVHLGDTATFDCSGPQLHGCPFNPIPSQLRWMNADVDHFGMRDANLSPDFPTAARLIMQLYQSEVTKYHPERGDGSVDGVIMITPTIIKEILKLTGPITVPGFKTVDATNLQDVIHYYHILNRNTYAGGNADTKAIDAALGSALLRKVAKLSGDQQSALYKQILAGFGTRDLQVYIDDPKVQSVLSALHMDAAVPMPAGADGLMVTDVNVGATYFNQDLQESVVDRISFDAQGNALHDMTLTYTLPKVQHLYTPIYIVKVGDVITPQTFYAGVTRVLVPGSARALAGTPAVTQCTAPTSCSPASAGEVGYKVWAVRVSNFHAGTNSKVVLHMKWMSPNVLKTVNGVTQYTLHLYKQAGSHITYNIIITPPSQARVMQPLPALFKTPANATPGSAAEYAVKSLPTDMLLTLSFSGG